jgi:cytochrome P450
MRAVFGVHDEERLARFEGLIEDFSKRVGLITTFPALRKNFGPGSPWPRFLRSRAKLDEFIYEEIGLRRKEVEAGEEGHDDVLSLLLQARHDDGSPMSDEELRDELVTVLGAGHETTATGLAWAVELLTRNPAVLAKLRDSLAAGEEEYLGATVKETLRARPVIVDVARKLKAPATIGGYELQAGQFVLPAIAALHYRADLFPEPDEFRPERFLEGKADNYAWIPFGGGVRRCIGAAFAEYEMRMILREFVERAELRSVGPKPERVKVRNITLAPAHGTRVKLTQPLA